MVDEFITKLSETCRSNIQDNSGDYEDENGILICGKCHTPRQTDITILGKTIRVYCSCKCRTEAFEKERAERRAQEARFRAEQMRQEGFYDKAYLSMSFQRDDSPGENLSKAARHYAEAFTPTLEQHGIMFMGNVGTGKTFYACCIANAVIDRGFSAWVTTLPPLIRAMSDRLSAKETTDRLQQVDLLVLDDFGATAQNSFTTEKLFEIIDARYRCGKPLIITTNLRPTDMENAPVAMLRIYDRLKERCRAVVVNGESRRKPC